jgi:hypothetical protein
MTTAELVSYFSVLQDKYGSPNVISTEIVSFLNHATNEWLNRLMPDSEGGVVNFEEDSNVTAQVRPLIYTISISTDSNGLLTDTAINTALSTAVGSAATIFRPMSIVVGTSPAKYVKHNNIGAYLKNSYKAPTTSFRLYTDISAGYQFYPQSTTSLSFTLMKAPRVLVSGSVDPEFDDYVMYNILSIALSYAGIATRDGELQQLIQSNSLQGSK